MSNIERDAAEACRTAPSLRTADQWQAAYHETASKAWIYRCERDALRQQLEAAIEAIRGHRESWMMANGDRVAEARPRDRALWAILGER